MGGSQSQAQAGQLSVDAFLQQARDYDRAATTPIGRLLRRQMEGSLTHPLPVMRVRELDRWFRGNAYKAIASRGTPIARVAATAGATAAASSSS